MPKPKISYNEKPKPIVIIGYGFEKGDKWPLPIFKSDLNTFHGKVYKTLKQAKEAMK